jgi:sec-independent protein translocase protein TatA
MPFNVGPMELFIILVIVLVLFGAKRVPEIGASIGKGIREFKKSMSDVDRAIRDPERDTSPSDRLPAANADPVVRGAEDEARPEPKRLLN